MKMPSEAARAYFYRVALAILAVLVLVGVISGDDLPVWANVAAAVFAVAPPALATLNTTTRRPDPPVDRSNEPFGPYDA